MRKTLVIVYSLTGTGRRLADLFARRQGWPVAEVLDRWPRTGRLGMLRSALDAALRRRPRIRYTGPALETFDSVLLIAPVWVGRLAAPMRSFVAAHAERLPELAFVSVSGSPGPSTAPAEIADLARRTPLLVAAFTAKEVACDDCADRVDALAAALRGRPGGARSAGSGRTAEASPSRPAAAGQRVPVPNP
jgi:hypothetical protein